MIFEKILMILAGIFIIWELYKFFNVRIITNVLNDSSISPFNKWEKRFARFYAIVGIFGLFSIAWSYWLVLNLLSITTAVAIKTTSQYRHQHLAIKIDTLISIILLICIIFVTINTTYYV